MSGGVQDGLLPGELGLLTIAERRGAVRVPKVAGDRFDVALAERIALIDRLVHRGFLVERADTDEPERCYEISEEGRRALRDSDRPAKPRPDALV